MDMRIWGLAAGSVVLSGLFVACRRFTMYVEPLGHDINFIQKHIQQSDPLLGVIPLSFENVQLVKIGKNSMYLGVIRNLNSKISDYVTQTKNPFLPPFEEGIHICDLLKTHRLLKNKFQVVRNHVLLVTQEYQSQISPLTASDLILGMLVVKAIGKHGLLFYNCGKNSGYSQDHKHLQILPISEHMHLIEAIRNYVLSLKVQSSQPIKYPGFQFRHGIFPLNLPYDDKEVVGKYLLGKYTELHSRTVREGESFNLLMTQELMVIIPRKKERAFNLVSLNGLGFSGALGVRNQEIFDQVRLLSLDVIFAQVTFAWD